MNAELAAVIEGRHLVLRRAGTPCLTLPLDLGGRHRLVVADAATARRVVSTIEACPGSGILPASGGLLGAMSVAENFSLALRYGEEEAVTGDDERQLVAALRLCGLSDPRIAALGRELPMKLDRAERWTAGFARWLVRPPELLVIDRLFAGLTRREVDALIAVEAAYHRRHPFRPVLFVDLDSHELPELPECRSLTDLAESPCHC